MRMHAIFWMAVIAAGALTVGGADAQVLVQIPPSDGGRPVPPAPEGWTYHWVPPQYDWVTRRSWVEGRTEWVREWVEIHGHMEEVWRQVTTPGRWEERSERVMVSPGRWELFRVGPPVPWPVPRPVAVSDGTVGVEGYARDGGEDLSKFSGLKEWPK